MVYSWLYDNFGWLGLLAGTALGGLAFWAVFVNWSYHYYFVRHRERYVPDYVESADELRAAKRWSVVHVLGNAALLLPVQLLIVFNWSRLYVGVDPYGWPYLVLSAVGAVVFAETAIYWAHRLVHLRPLYGWLHSVHHRFRETNPHVTYAFHPVDSFFQGSPYQIYAFIVPLNFSVYLFLFVFSSFWTVIIHDRVRWIPSFLAPYINYSGCHAVHHWCIRYNYGNYFTFWDKLCGTYCEAERLPEKFFAAKLAPLRPPIAEAAAALRSAEATAATPKVA